jgi:lipopolysaccharide transport system ATP-binding protein
MTVSIKVRDLTKIFALAARGGSSASLTEILRSGSKRPNMREVHALRALNFDIAKGERVGIIGGNGAGKTTLLSILAGLTDATSGTVNIVGDVHAMLSIGMVLREDMTGRENIFLDASIHGKAIADNAAIVDRIIEFSELGEFIERPVRTYSSGMKARLAFSMGAFITPDILILDETLSVGDAFFASKASRRMREVANSGSIVIVVSHAMATIRDMCNRCLWLANGQLMADGDSATVTKAYEAAVQQSDEADMLRKFNTNAVTAPRPEAGSLAQARIVQDAADRTSTLVAMHPVKFEISGVIERPMGRCDVQVRIGRVDGRRVWEGALSTHGQVLPGAGAFVVAIEMDPFVLGADLYQLVIELRDEQGVCDTLVRVFEVIDEEGQVGGKPLLYYPAEISVRRTGE